MNHIPRWARLALPLLAFAILTACAKKPVVGDETDYENQRARLGHFTVSLSGQEPMQRPHLRYKKHDLLPVQEPVRQLSVSKETIDFPNPGCVSIKTEQFTGGANCCFGYYLLSICPDGDHAAFIEPYNGGVGEPQKTRNAYPLNDDFFMYYSPEKQTGKKILSFSRAESPRPTRHIVFDNGAWRPDKPGEFHAAYAALADDARDAKDMSPEAKAISVAYYDLMSGEASSSVEKKLKANLPPTRRQLSATIFADIEKAATSFNPVRNLDIPHN